MLYNVKDFNVNFESIRGNPFTAYYEMLKSTSLTGINNVRYLTPEEEVGTMARAQRGRDGDLSTFRGLHVEVEVPTHGNTEYQVLIPTPDNEGIILKSGTCYSLNWVLRGLPVRVEHTSVVLTFPKEKLLFDKNYINYLINSNRHQVVSLVKVIANKAITATKKYPAIAALFLKHTFDKSISLAQPGLVAKVVLDSTKYELGRDEHVFALTLKADNIVVVNTDNVNLKAARLIISVLRVIQALVKSKKNVYEIQHKENVLTCEEVDILLRAMLARKETATISKKERDVRYTRLNDHLSSPVMSQMPRTLIKYKEYDEWWLNFEDEVIALPYEDKTLYHRKYDTWSYAYANQGAKINNIIMTTSGSTKKNFSHNVSTDLSLKSIFKYITSGGLCEQIEVCNGNSISSQLVTLEENISVSTTGNARSSIEDRDMSNELRPSSLIIGSPFGVTKAKKYVSPEAHLNGLASYEDGFYNDAEGIIAKTEKELNAAFNTSIGHTYNKKGEVI